MKFRKRLSIILTVAMVLTAGLSGSYAETSEDAKERAARTSASDTPFTDISGHWAESIIKEASVLGIAGGYSDGTFLPDNLIKREEFFKLLANILTDKPDTANTKIPFTDVVDGEWYVPAIKIAVASGITSGYGDGTFGIGLMISRQEAAKVAGSVIPTLGTEDEKGAETARDKAQIADWAYQYVDLLFKKGYMRGDTEGYFRPTTALTRAEAVTILLNIKKNEPVISANADELAATDCMAAHVGQEGVFVKGSGTKNDPYEIAREEQLDHMRMHVTEGAFYVLTKNIAITKDYAVTSPAVNSGEPDWTDGNFVPIGSKESPFKGFLTGNGYTISGLNIIGTTSRSANKKGADYAGLFGYLAQGSGVTDVIIDASTISGNQYAGAVAGYSEGTVTDCQLGKKGIVKGAAFIGGLVGYSTKPLSSLRNRGEVTGTQSNTGGIVGYISAGGKALVYCQNEGKVSGKNKTGGIAGMLISSPDTAAAVEECYNKGAVTGDSYHAGGIAGIASGGNNSVTIADCANTGEVGGTGVNGGIVGLSDSKKVTISNCRNTGTVEGSGAGGIAGNNQGRIALSYNSGAVKGELNGGGIAAYQHDGEGSISKSYNEGNVSSDYCAGGITGENDSNVDNCYNSGKVRAVSLAGGISGKNSGFVTNVYGAGTVTGDTDKGSLIGRNSGYLNNGYWLGSSATLGVGLEDNATRQKGVKKVTHEELSGQKKISTIDGYIMLIELMNANNATASNKRPDAVWEYLYKIAIPAPDSFTVVSDGGNIVPPLTMPSLDSSGNTIDPSDLTTKYLYPSLIKD